MIAIIDYGMGNLRSVQKACQYVGCDAVVTSDAEKIKSADRLILPGVGAARDAIENLKKKELWQLILDQAAAGKPLWAYVWECSCCLTKAWRTERMNVSGWSEGRSCRLKRSCACRI